MKRVIYLILAMILIIVGIYFAVLNADNVTLHYSFGSTEVPLSFILVIAMIIGAILGVAASASLFVGSRREIARLKKKVDVAEKEVNNLRSIPLRDEH